MNHICIPVKCEYIHANEGYDKLINAIGSVVEDGDIVVISETPISVIEGNVVDESVFDYSFLSLLIVEFWCKFLWGYVFALFNYNSRTISNLRKLPVEARNHKEFILREYGLKHALMPSGDAGVDLSNVPGTFVSLLPDNPDKSVLFIKNLLHECFGVEVEVVIIDTDPTFEFCGRLYTSIPKSVEGIVNDTGVYGYFLRFFSKHVGATPIASTLNENASTLIDLANIAEDCQEKHLSNFFETIYDMTDRFSAGYDEISEDMLEEVNHIPAVLIRSKYL